MSHFLLVSGDSSRPVGVVIMEAPSMLDAHTNAVARGVAADATFGEVHELTAKMMTSILPTQIGRMISGGEAAQMIGRLVEGRERPEEMTGRFPRPIKFLTLAAIFSQAALLVPTLHPSSSIAKPITALHCHPQYQSVSVMLKSHI
jgi:hypothetical protein